MVFNTVPSGSCGMTMGLSYDPKRHMTQGFFGYRVVPGFYSYGAMVIQDLKSTARYIPEPLLLPFAAYEQLEYKFQKDLLAASTALDIFNRDKRFTDIFLDSDSDQAQTSSVTLGYQDLHRTIVNYHTILANSYGPFLTAFGLSLRSACSKLEQQSFSGGVDGSDTPECQRYDSFQSRQCIETLIARSEYLHLSRSRLLTKMDIYLQVIHNFMQQDIARETKRDSSAMKSLSLLTMVFLPTTAIATIMDPFTQVSWNDEITVTSQFWVFWAAAAPVTLIVLIIGVSWIHKAECQQAFMTKVAHLKRFGLFQRRVKVGDIESKAESNLIVLRTTMAIQDASESASDTATAPRRSTSGRSSKAVEDCVAV
ncbi:hypothetical protein QBC38DRAFT_466843 [Podospora fimiseda]|uniref:Uncharacterized protein n=1 Tax=Podospora fimiseda TaxID=252190 RepID=A0AAN7H4T9_9PEZI|nr:hypothetical protein QBC38DRAFT_466843 [Podospora fimiseda]